MSTSTMHFGPEWMRTRHQPLSRSQPPPSPPPSATNLSGSGASTYSALVSVPPPSSDKGDEVHPFRYSKDELLRIYQEGGGKGGLGLEVERWEGVVRELGAEPTALREMTEAEKKLFAGPLNSELRRRPSQTADYLSPLTTSNLDRSRMSHTSSAAPNSPLRERFGGMKRRDSSGNNPDSTLSVIPRKPSLSALQTPLSSPREASPRTRSAYTPGFDGVLNSGDSWMARRRVSETSLKPGSLSEEESQLNGKHHSILEEKEEELRRSGPIILPDEQRLFPSTSYGLTDEPDQYTTPETTTKPYPQDSAAQSQVSTYHDANVGPPPGLMDLAAVEWSYKDPTGQVQGPFRADLMQRWFNEGYFTSDLPMKRTHIDTNWTTVDELIKRSVGDNIFLSPLVSARSGRQNSNGSSVQSSYTFEQTFSEPYQPAPIRSLRTSTLESYLNSASLTSDSPSSSGASLGNHSPDPPNFGGRDGKTHLPDTAAAGRLSSLPATTFGSFTSEQDLGASDFPYNTTGYASHDPWMGQVAIGSPGFGNARDLTVDRVYLSSSTNIDTSTNSERVPSNAFSPLEQSQRPGAFNTGSIYTNGECDYSNHDSSHTCLGLYGQSAAAAPLISVPNLRQHPPSIPNHPHSPSVFEYRNLAVEASLTQSAKHDRTNVATAPPRSPWKTIPEATGSILAAQEAKEASVTNVSLPSTQISSSSPWPRVDESLFLSSSISPEQPLLGVSASGVTWRDESNLSNATAGTLLSNIPPQVQAPVDFVDLNNVNTYQAVTLLQVTPPSASAENSPLSTTSLLKATKPGFQTSGNTGVNQKPEEVTASATVQKIAWAIEEEPQKKKGPAPSVSLREIQEAEAKKAESRKAMERDKERLVRATPAADAKELQSFTTSWGLPTSQAGARNNTGAAKEPPTSTPTSTSLPVWTTPSKQPLPKNSMKEIQEEEEKRKKLATKDAVAVSVPKRAYADTTTKVITPATPSSNTSAWTTVGPNGKVPAVLAPPMARSAQVVPPLSAASAFSRPIGPPAQRQAATSTLKPRPTKEDTPYSPSRDFLRWLSDSLKGLNSSVNVEEIIAMLLSFPLDPDQSTIEIISDTIYSNSTTLDGRRFASEFVTKRKADVSSRPQNALAPGKPSPKPVSIADVVKATPKTAQPEWGFKVVNKKKKGGRS